MSKIVNRRFMILFILVAIALAVSPAYAGSPPATGQETSQPTLPVVQPYVGVDTQLSNFDCSQVQSLGIDKQLNMRAGLIRIQCGLDSPGSLQMNTGNSSSLALVAGNGGTDVQVNNALADPFPKVTQSTTSFAAHGSTVVAAYNSSTDSPNNYSGISYSQDGGITFTEIRPSPFATGHGTNYGEPITIFSDHADLFYTFWLTTGCGGQGIGTWNSSDGVTWTLGTCAHNGGSDDRQEAWVDNNPASPYYGRIYVTFNNFSVGNGALTLVYSADNGATWSSDISINPSFIRNVMGVSRSDGHLFLAAMDEGGGGLNPRQNWIYISQDGGLTWNGTAMGSAFPAPGDTSCSYFEAIAPIWRYMGWGSLGAGPDGVLHYVYTAGAPGDIGDIFYTRSTDGGLTWSSPVRINTDAGTRAQWMPSIGVTPQGMVAVSWYDRRNTANNDYQRYSRVSLDNGVTWKADQPLSDQVIPQPSQPDPNVNACYAGDYDRNATLADTVIGGWTDGRISINSTPQQDVYADQISAPSLAMCVSGESAWQLDAGLPIDLYGSAVASNGNYVYSAGGYNFTSGYINTFARYSLGTNTWTVLPPLPSAVSLALGAYDNGKFYVFGGQDNSGVLNITQVYDSASNTWSYGPPLPEVRTQMGGGAYKGKIYLVGGYSTGSVDPGSTKDQTWAFDPATGTYTILAVLPSPLGGPASAVINGKLYIAGGRDPNNVALSTLYSYDIAANNWSVRAPLPIPVNVAGGAALAGKLWVMGGGNPFLDQASAPDGSNQTNAPETISAVQVYNPASNTWAPGPHQLVSRSFQSAVAAGGTIVSIGGYTGTTTTAVVESFLRQRLNTLLIYSDITFPASLQSQLLSLPGVGSVDTFDSLAATPTPAQLQQYDMVVTFSNYPYSDPTTLGNELADYVDNGGVVFELAFDWLSPWNLGGRWVADGYSVFNLGTQNYSYASLGALQMPGSELLAGVNNLSAYYRINLTPSAGASTVANWSDATPLLAYKGHVVGVSGYFGEYPPPWSGDMAQLISNAGFSMRTPAAACNKNIVYLPLTVK